MMLQIFEINLVYRQGKEFLLSDALSRVYPENYKFTICLENDIQSHVCLVDYEVNTTGKIEQLKLETSNDQQLCALNNIILEGWPNNNKHVPDNLKVYCPYKSNLCV